MNLNIIYQSTIINHVDSISMKEARHVQGNFKKNQIPHWEDQDEQRRGRILMSLCIMMIDLEV